MPPKSVWKFVEVIKSGCEEWGEPQTDEVSLRRHVKEMLDLEREPPELAPAEIVEEYVEDIFSIELTVTADNQTTTGHLGSWTEIRAAAEWAWASFATSLESIRQPATRRGTGLSSTGCSKCDALTSSSGCRPCLDPLRCIFARPGMERLLPPRRRVRLCAKSFRPIRFTPGLYPARIGGTASAAGLVLLEL